MEQFVARRGEVIGNNYVVGNILGMGGMGVVYTALQRSLDRVVALKMPRPELARDPQIKDRLRREALASSRISHRNSVRIFDYGNHAGSPYIVMELVTGPRLGQVLVEHGPLPIGLAARLVRDVAAVLEDAHLNGIVHADVKCNNILIETLRDGSLLPRVIDWGIARFHDDHRHVDPALVTGTPEYLAPEVAAGALPTCAADVYALGILTYELISGATPRTRGGRVVPLTVICPELDLPEGLDALVARALAADPDERFTDAGVFVRALDAIPNLARAERRRTTSSFPSVFSTEAATA